MATKKTTSKKRSSKTVKRSSARGASKRTTTKKSVEKKSTQKIKSIIAHEVTVDYLDVAKKFSEARKKDTIHPRKIIPEVRKGAKVTDLTPTAAMSMEDTAEARRESRGAAPMAITDTISLVKNIQLDDVATADTASHVCEPSGAVNGDVIFYTGNWFAAISLNGGNSFMYIDPYTTFPDPPGMGFCCDQIVHYVKSVDRFVWLLQYTQGSSNENILRIAYATTKKIKTGNWKYFDLTPTSLGCAAGTWLDFPDLSTGKNMLYVTTNNFNSSDVWKSSVVARIKLTSFTSGVLSASVFRSTSFPSLRVAQNCLTTAYFASHRTTSQLRVFSWSESSATPSFSDVTVASWNDQGYSSTTPDGKNWLKRADRRHTGATYANKEVWFAWGSAKGGVNNRPHAFAQIARISTTTMTLVENISLWDPDNAIFYAALATNKNNEVGVSFAMGGPTKFPMHLVGILTGTRRQVKTFNGNRGPADNKWGDYLTVRRNYANQKLFFATGYVLKSGSGSSDATPHFTIFGREGDV